MQFFSSQQHFIQRYNFIALLGIIFLIIITIQLIRINTDNELKQKSVKQSNRIINFEVGRGEIFDRNGNILAGNIAKINVNIDPQNIPLVGFNNILSIWRLSPEYQEISNSNLTKYIKNGIVDKNIQNFDVIKYLAKLSNNNYRNLNNKIVSYKKDCNTKTMDNCRRWYYLATKMNILGELSQSLKQLKEEKILICRNYTPPLNKAERLLNFFITVEKATTISCKKTSINGIYFENIASRIYPHSPSTTPLFGAINHNNTGVFGLERTYQDYLKEKKFNKKIIKYNGNKENYYNTGLINNKKSNNLQLTIDAKIQFYLFDAIREAVNKHKATSGAGIIVNKDGEIIAITSFPTNDINNGISSNYEYYVNRALKDNLEIASTIKPLITSALIEENKIDLDEIISLSTEETKNYKNHYGKLSIREIITKSYTPGSIKISSRIDDATTYDYLQRLGFGESISVLPNISTNGVLKHFYNWSDSDYKAISYGYGPLNSSLAQLVRSYLVFLNDGKIKNLKLLANANNTENQVFSPKTINKIIPVLENVVNNGTAINAKLTKVQAAGKTGTSRLVINGKYKKGRTNAFFIGFAPSRDAKYLMAVVINDPRDYSSREGGQIAAPVFKNVMEKIFID